MKDYEVNLTSAFPSPVYLPESSVFLASETSGRPSSIVISVSDTGIGIKDEGIARLFQPFIRLEAPLKAAVPGTGLGLYLTKKLVTEALKGDIMVESTFGKGSKFTLLLTVS